MDNLESSMVHKVVKNKVIIIDWGILVHKAIFAWPNNKAVPPTYTGCSMAIGWLYRLNVDPDDIIIVACDGRNSWRKDYQDAYKGDRAEKRASMDIPFEKFYGEFNELAERLNAGLDWHFIKIDRLEADDVMAVACRFYNDRPVVLCTHDADLHQMWEYPNVRIFSTLSKKWKLRPENFDVKRLQAEKIYKETTDNMVAPILNEEDYEKRRMCVDLIHLPDNIENAVLGELRKIGPKDCNIGALPFKSMQERLMNLYTDKSKVMSYEDQVAKLVAEEECEKRKKLEAKEKEKKKKEREAKKIEKQKEKEAKILKRIQKLEEKNNGKICESSNTEEHVGSKT